MLLKEDITKPKWENSPEWAKWLAKDMNGDWNWFKERPTPDTMFGHWYTRYSKMERAVKGDGKGYCNTWVHTRERIPDGLVRCIVEKEKVYRFNSVKVGDIALIEYSRHTIDNKEKKEVTAVTEDTFTAGSFIFSKCGICPHAHVRCISIERRKNEK